MSVEGQVLGASIAGGGMGGGISLLAHTGNPALVGFLIGLVMIVALGFITRKASQN